MRTQRNDNFEDSLSIQTPEPNSALVKSPVNLQMLRKSSMTVIESDKSQLSEDKDEDDKSAHLLLPLCNDVHSQAKSIEELLTDSRKNEIKRQIGRAFLDILKQITIKRILNKHVNKRNDWEAKQLIDLVRS